MNIQRYTIAGKSGSGKTTLSRQLSEILSIPHVELDAVHWQPNWRGLPKDEFRERLSPLVPAEGAWIVDGNYRVVRDLTWGRAQVLVWLDYSLMFTLCRLIKRTFGRLWYQRELWNGNKESVSNFMTLDTHENLFLLTIFSHFRSRKEYIQLFKTPEYAHLTVLRFRSPSETEAYLKHLRQEHSAMSR